MKVPRLVLLVLLLVITNGCFTTHYVVEWKAKRHVEFDEKNSENVEVPGRPIYYALLPLTIPVDIVTAPIQFGILMAWPVAKTPQAPETTKDSPD
jgi:C4-dicarboxylate transporter